MAVKKLEKKDLESKSQRGSMGLSPELERVRRAISTLPTEEHDMTQEENQTAGEEANETSKTDSKSKNFKKTKKAQAKKKAGAKKKATGVKKTSGVTKKPAADQVQLADLCKENGIKIKPRAARRILRTAKVKNPGRWAWDKNSAGLAAARKVLKESQAE